MIFRDRRTETGSFSELGVVFAYWGFLVQINGPEMERKMDKKYSEEEDGDVGQREAEGFGVSVKGL